MRLEARKDPGFQHRELLKPHRVDHSHLETAVSEEPGLASTSHLFTHHFWPDAVNNNIRQADPQPEPVQGHLDSLPERGKAQTTDPILFP